MNWKEWLTYNPYKKLWSLIGGRPWTYISRDIYHKAEYVVLMGLLIVGFYASKVLTDVEFWVILGAISLGFIWGHFFWGRPYIPGQEGE